MKADKVLTYVILVIVAIALVGLAVPVVLHAGSYYDVTESFSRYGVRNRNVSLIQEVPCREVIRLHNGTVTIPASNYTSYLPGACKVLIEDNSSVKGSKVYVDYYFGYRLEGVYLILASLIAIIFVVGVLYKFYKPNFGSR